MTDKLYLISKGIHVKMADKKPYENVTEFNIVYETDTHYILDSPGYNKTFGVEKKEMNKLLTTFHRNSLMHIHFEAYTFQSGIEEMKMILKDNIIHTYNHFKTELAKLDSFIEQL